MVTTKTHFPLNPTNVAAAVAAALFIASPALAADGSVLTTLVSVREHLESDESSVIQERWPDPLRDTDVDDAEPAALRPQQTSIPERFDRRGMGALRTADTAG